VLGLGRVILFATLTFGAGLVAFALSRSLVLSLALLPIVGAGFMIQMASTNTIIQTIVEERLRGRVMAFYTMAFLGTAPIGSLIGGSLAARIGAPHTIALGGVACALGALWFATRLPMLREIVRPVYVERGILTMPALDTGGKNVVRERLAAQISQFDNTTPSFARGSTCAAYVMRRSVHRTRAPSATSRA